MQFLDLVACGLVSFAAVFWMSRNAPTKEPLGGALRDIQKTAAKETRSSPARQFTIFLMENSSLSVIPLSLVSGRLV